jgi:hypothetical protein
MARLESQAHSQRLSSNPSRSSEAAATGDDTVVFWRKRDSDCPGLWPLSASPSMFWRDGSRTGCRCSALMDVVAQPLSDNVSTLRGDGVGSATSLPASGTKVSLFGDDRLPPVSFKAGKKVRLFPSSSHERAIGKGRRPGSEAGGSQTSHRHAIIVGPLGGGRWSAARKSSRRPSMSAKPAGSLASQWAAKQPRRLFPRRRPRSISSAPDGRIARSWRTKAARSQSEHAFRASGSGRSLLHDRP